MRMKSDVVRLQLLVAIIITMHSAQLIFCCNIPKSDKAKGARRRIQERSNTFCFARPVFIPVVVRSRSGERIKSPLPKLPPQLAKSIAGSVQLNYSGQSFRRNIDGKTWIRRKRRTSKLRVCSIIKGETRHICRTNEWSCGRSPLLCLHQQISDFEQNRSDNPSAIETQSKEFSESYAVKETRKDNEEIPILGGEEWSWETTRRVTSRPYLSEAIKQMSDKEARLFFRRTNFMQQPEAPEQRSRLPLIESSLSPTTSLIEADNPPDSLVVEDDVYIDKTTYDDDLEDCMAAFLAAGEQEEYPESCGEGTMPVVDPLWEQIKLEAQNSLEEEPMAGPQLYQGILSQPALVPALSSIISNELSTELVPATAIKNLFCELLTDEDERCIHYDIMAAAVRSPSTGSALNAILFNRGLHALVCHRVAHRLWLVDRTGFAKYMQSLVSRTYSADIHPAAIIGAGIYMNAGSGIVIGETATVGDDVSILQGVTLGGTGKERGDRHPKVGDGVILSDSSTVLGNIKVGDGAIVMPKSIVTKAVPSMARVRGVPAKVVSYRRNLIEMDEEDIEDPLKDWISCAERQLRLTYERRWNTSPRDKPKAAVTTE